LEKCEAAYKKAAQEYIDYELETKITSTMQEETLKKAERFIVAALQYNDKGEIVRDEKQAESIWCAWVDEVGEQNASAFLVLTVNHISGANEEVEGNDFFTQTKAKAEERANNRRNGLRRVK
jgi:protein associated with RNAse G/E